MRAMSRIERFFERLVERPSARLFRARLQPIQLLRRIERAMESERGIGGQSGLVPDRFTVHLHPDDLAGLAPVDIVAADLASAALSFARGHGYALRERPRVSLRADAALAAGEIEVDTDVSPAAPAVVDTDRADGGTRVFEVPAIESPKVTLEVREPGQAPRRLPVAGGLLQIGRGGDCDIVLRDSRVSRRHARLQARGGVLVLTDLGSTNGTLVNGHRVSEVVLGAGDRIQLGESSLTVQPAESSGRG
jgi:hypothetical protein